ncbi:putative S-adenosyl-L-methionine-dependent RNA methyltransferase RSM22, mitochondrial [Erysiphe neolycopersici]|uniref:Putative S-adenosyl-L-methionine-dependent RNA methyltransferase RSM22, mitochondrial n=1 Tax=Erysiphe neolycopersici TaxID=212602 RepID=A0A420HG74_9PEZI|nr:putative S-adenosyl-L-methionine-dependent RNA methyltransferase RSM22, mitochondrial [Erysiphe neolycopersici]
MLNVFAKCRFYRQNLYLPHQSGLRVCVCSRSYILCKDFKRRRVEQKHSLYYKSPLNKILKSISTPKFDNQSFSTCKILSDDLQPSFDEKESSFNELQKYAEIESLVRHARQTFGDTLPKDYFSKEEYVVYERLFGPPLRETTILDIRGYNDTSIERPQSVLLRENEDGELEELSYESPSQSRNESSILTAHNDASHDEEFVDKDLLVESDNVDRFQPEENLQSQIKPYNEREAKAIIQLHRNHVKLIAEMEQSKEIEIEKNMYIGEDKYENNEEDQEVVSIEDEQSTEDLFTSSDANRTHPHTIASRSRSNPSTLCVPNQNFVVPVTELLTRTNPTHLQLAAEKAFGGKGLPFSVSIPSSMKHLPQKEIGLSASQYRMSEIEADAYISAVMPGAYASIMSILVEVRKRLGQTWLRDLLLSGNGEGPNVIDAGSGGAGIIAWNRIVEAEWEIMKDEGIVKGDFIPFGKSNVVTGSDSLRHRASKLLDNTTFLPRLPDYIHATQNDGNSDGGLSKGRKMFNIVIAPYILLAEKEQFKRKNMIKNLWTLVNPNGGILIIVEKGLPRGFEAVAEARSFILSTYIDSTGIKYTENDIDSSGSETREHKEKEEGMIVAPCTNHLSCPMYLNSGVSSGRKDFCHFSQRYIRPPFLQKLLDAKARNHEDLKFSYIVFRRGIDDRKNFSDLLSGDKATSQSFEGYEVHDLPESHQDEDYVETNIKFNTLSLPRVILSPLKRHGHVTLDLCTPSAQIERWTIPKSFSKVAYRDARKSKWGDLWALGAKTRVMKNLRLGNPINAKSPNFEKNLKNKVNKYDIVFGKDGFKRFERAGKKIIDRYEKRTKGGRLSKGPKPIGEDDF